MTKQKYQNLPPLAKIAEIERIKAGYPEDHTQVSKINRQIEEIKRKERLK